MTAGGDPRHRLKVTLQGLDNETYTGTLVLNNITSFLLPDTSHTHPKDVSGRSRMKDDPTGASYYVIAVVLVYGMSIVMLIASHIKRKQGKLVEDKQIHKYLQEFMVVKEKSSRDSYKHLKKSIMAKLNMERKQTYRNLTHTILPMMAVGLPAIAESPRSIPERRSEVDDMSSVCSMEDCQDELLDVVEEEEDEVEEDAEDIERTFYYEKARPLSRIADSVPVQQPEPRQLKAMAAGNELAVKERGASPKLTETNGDNNPRTEIIDKPSITQDPGQLRTCICIQPGKGYTIYTVPNGARQKSVRPKPLEAHVVDETRRGAGSPGPRAERPAGPPSGGDKPNFQPGRTGPWVPIAKPGHPEPLKKEASSIRLPTQCSDRRIDPKLIDPIDPHHNRWSSPPRRPRLPLAPAPPPPWSRGPGARLGGSCSSISSVSSSSVGDEVWMAMPGSEERSAATPSPRLPGRRPSPLDFRDPQRMRLGRESSRSPLLSPRDSTNTSGHTSGHTTPRFNHSRSVSPTCSQTQSESEKLLQITCV